MKRRTWLRVGLAAGVALSAAAVGVSLTQGAAITQDNRVTPRGREVLDAVARAVLDGRLPSEPEALQRALDAHALRFMGVLTTMPAQARSEVAKLLSVLASAPGRIALAGLNTPWAQAPVSRVSEALQRMRSSGWVVRRQAYHALRDLTQAAQHVDEGSWAQMGYPGPRAIP